MFTTMILSIMSRSQFETWKFMMEQYQGKKVNYLNWIIIQIKRYFALKRMFRKQP